MHFISANHILYNIGYLEQTGENNSVILMKSTFYNFSKKYARKWNFMKKKNIKIYLLDGACLCILFQCKDYIVCYRIRQENTKCTVSFPGKTILKLKKYSKILLDSVILELISLNGWQVCCF